VFSLQLSIMAMLIAAMFGLNLYGYYLPAFLGLILGLDGCVRKMQRGVEEKAQPQPGWARARQFSVPVGSPAVRAEPNAGRQQAWQRPAR
jgi:hypothetical protein